MVPVVLGGRHLPCLAWEPCSWDQVPVWAGVPGRDSAQVRAAGWCRQSCVRADRDSPASGAVVMAAVTHTRLRPSRQPAAAGAQVGGGTPRSHIAQACSLTAAVGTMGIWPSPGPCGMTAPQDRLATSRTWSRCQSLALAPAHHAGLLCTPVMHAVSPDRAPAMGPVPISSQHCARQSHRQCCSHHAWPHRSCSRARGSAGPAVHPGHGVWPWVLLL